MFTGIIETTGKITDLEKEGSNIRFTIQSPISPELKIDQSVSHDGVCLTVVSVHDGHHSVIAVQETLSRSNLNRKTAGTIINLERCLLLNQRLDGHIVQGHIDESIRIKSIKEMQGSWLFTFFLREKDKFFLVEKGSVCINGVSLTVKEVKKKSFSVVIIPYTFEHTNFQFLKESDKVNVEYDIIGKYFLNYLKKK
ncbi:MAG: riboflavin synthase [Chitinophagales bacterium]|nr:riboflavin synthase [Chitinophagales bacterium]